jgi:acetyltransferase-like isoleucine patch superfamily enzyme
MSLRRSIGRAMLGLYRTTVRLRSKSFSILASGAFAEFGSGSVVQLPVRLSGESRMAIGSRVFVGAGAWLQVLADVEPEAGVALRIGDDCAFAGGSVLSAVRSITLGDHVTFARNCYVADHSHAYRDVATNIDAQGLTDVNPVQIDSGVWLGENVVVLPGVHIGTGAVVGANSVVNRDLPSFSVALGSPARVVHRFGPADGDE